MSQHDQRTLTQHDIQAIKLIERASPERLQEMCAIMYLGFASRLLSFEGGNLPLLLLHQTSGIYDGKTPAEIKEAIKVASGKKGHG